MNRRTHGHDYTIILLFVRKIIINVNKKNIMTHMTIDRQRLRKTIPEVTLSTMEGFPLLGNRPLNTHP
jgi:hypothetical protein